MKKLIIPLLFIVIFVWLSILTFNKPESEVNLTQEQISEIRTAFDLQP